MTGKSLGKDIDRDSVEVGGFTFPRHAGDRASRANERDNGGKQSPRLYRYWDGNNYTLAQLRMKVCELKLK